MMPRKSRSPRRPMMKASRADAWFATMQYVSPVRNFSSPRIFTFTNGAVASLVTKTFTLRVARRVAAQERAPSVGSSRSSPRERAAPYHPPQPLRRLARGLSRRSRLTEGAVRIPKQRDR